MKRLLLLTLVGSLSCAAVASEPSAAYTRCMDQSGGVTLKMRECQQTETAAQDARLNRNYQSALKRVEGSQQAELRQVQRLWIQYRDANCGLSGHLTGGTIDAINQGACLLDMTRQRADELHQFNNPEG